MATGVSGVRIVRADERPVVPWRNGLGTTCELVSDGQPWSWRVSVADVRGPAQFSAFPDVERVLTVVEGGGLVLAVDGAQHRVESLQPFRFDGGATTAAIAVDGPLRVVNVMADPRRWRVQVDVVTVAGHIVVRGSMAVVVRGGITAREATLVPTDALVDPDDRDGTPVEVAGDGVLLIARLTPTPSD